MAVDHRVELVEARALAIARGAAPSVFERPRRTLTRAERRALTRRRTRLLADARRLAERELRSTQTEERKGHPE